MPKVKNIFGMVHEVEEGHWSLNDPDYQVLDDGKHPVKDASRPYELDEQAWLADINNATDEDIDAYIAFKAVDIGKATSRETKIKKVLEQVSA